MRSFLAGLCTGAALLYFMLWWQGRLREAALPSISPSRLSIAAATPPPVPAASITPAAVPASAAPTPPPFAAEPTPLLGSSTQTQEPPSTLNPFAPAPAVPQIDAPPPHASPPPDLNDFQRLKARSIGLPVEGFDRRQLRDDFAEMRGNRVHEAIDLPAPRGTPVIAVDDGTVKKLFTSAAGGLTIYQFDPDSNYAYYYAHLDRYAEGLKEGAVVKKGERIGYVGTTGNAPPNTPHLHFTVFRLGPEKHWWEGTPINPYPFWILPEVARSSPKP
jgi:murein DD-endopeptidase MepM/ murein hydrolase activator NlpD